MRTLEPIDIWLNERAMQQDGCLEWQQRISDLVRDWRQTGEMTDVIDFLLIDRQRLAGILRPLFRGFKAEAIDNLESAARDAAERYLENWGDE